MLEVFSLCGASHGAANQAINAMAPKYGAFMKNVAEITEFDINTITAGNISEGSVDLSAFAQPSEGAWPSGWYKATIIESYVTKKGHQFITQDVLSKNGDSRNLRLCFAVTNGKETRNIQQGLNYRVEDFSADRLAAISEARAQYKGLQGKWPGAASDLQRSSLALAKLGQLQKAIGFPFKIANAKIDSSPLIGQAVDVHLRIDENGFNKISKFARAGSKAK
jgi:hypothetical protein